MLSPISVGVLPSVAIPKNRNRAEVSFQNAGPTTLYFTRQIGNIVNVPSLVNYDFFLAPYAVGIPYVSHEVTNSISAFNVVSDFPGGVLTIYETIKV